jgi:hypothetical protein
MIGFTASGLWNQAEVLPGSCFLLWLSRGLRLRPAITGYLLVHPKVTQHLRGVKYRIFCLLEPNRSPKSAWLRPPAEIGADHNFCINVWHIPPSRPRHPTSSSPGEQTILFHVRNES